MRPKKMVKTTIIRSGWRIAQAAPEHGLLVAHLHVAPGQEVDQLAKLPQLAEIDPLPALRRAGFASRPGPAPDSVAAAAVVARRVVGARFLRAEDSRRLMGVAAVEPRAEHSRHNRSASRLLTEGTTGSTARVGERPGWTQLYRTIHLREDVEARQEQPGDRSIILRTMPPAQDEVGQRRTRVGQPDNDGRQAQHQRRS